MNTLHIAAAVLACASSAWTAVMLFWLVLAVRRGESPGSVRCHAWCAAAMAVLAAVFAAVWVAAP